MASYSYDLLEPRNNSIRILILLPGSSHDLIQCKLQPESLDSNPEYEALSYVWGNDSNKRPIELHGYTHLATTNLECALRNLRRPNSSRRLWVDALCIDQNNLNEREEQVKKMTTIYMQATSVLSWLGEAADDSDQAMALIRSFGSLSRAYLHREIPEHHTLQKEQRDLMHWHDFFVMFYQFPMEAQNWIALWKLLDRTYWTRVWMVQELIGGGLFKDCRGYLVCGTEHVEKGLFDYLCMMIVSGTALSSSYEPVEGTQVEPSKTFRLLGHPRAFVMWEITGACAFGSSKGHGLDHLIKATKRLSATDARDKIYAILAMAPEKYQKFPINYTRPLKQILVDLVKFMLATENRLDILLGNRFSLESVEPSWTPELFQPDHGWIPGFTELKAAGETSPIVFFDADDNILNVKGVLVGTVRKVIGPEVLPEAGLHAQPPPKAPKYTGDILAFGRSLQTRTERENFWRALILNHDFRTLKSIYPAPDEFGPMAEAIFFGRPLPPEFMPDDPIDLRLATFAAPFLKSWERTRWNRCFFTTEEGHMGMGPFCVQPGDVAVVLLGGEFPFILRKSGSTYILVGDACIQGVMHGELVNGKYSDQMRIFSLH